MVEHKCRRCGKVFNKKSSYDYHTKKKIKPCKINKKTKNYKSILKVCKKKKECYYCGKVFSTISNWTRHMKTACPVIKNQRLEMDKKTKQEQCRRKV